MMKRIKGKTTDRIQILLLTAILLAVVAVFAFKGTGENLPEDKDEYEVEGDIPRVVEEGEPFTHETMRMEISGLEQVINIIVVDIPGERAVIKPVFSYNRIFGFEPLEELIQGHDALAAVNGGFFYEFGNPSGMVMVDGKVVTGSGGFPVLIIDGGKASLEILDTVFSVKGKSGEIVTCFMNVWGREDSWVIYTSMFGTDNRITSPHISLVVDGTEVSRILETSSPVEIPSGGMVISRLYSRESPKIPFDLYEEVYFSMTPQLGSKAQAYECGSMLVDNFQIVAPERDQWVGVLTNRDPRSAVGIREDGKVILVTVDGRQPGYSYGLTGRELAELLIGLGAKDGAMLDGGASTQMIIDKKTVNRPSFRGEGRPLAGGLIVQLE